MQFYEDTREILFDRYQPCDHMGCLSHVSHPCESCGRVGGDGIIYKSPTYIRQQRLIRH
jgi:hypothetical protein